MRRPVPAAAPIAAEDRSNPASGAVAAAAGALDRGLGPSHVLYGSPGAPIGGRVTARLPSTGSIGIADAGEATSILEEYGSSAVSGRNWTGQRTPLHATATGKALLASADDDSVKEALAADLLEYTPNTITDASALEAELGKVRARGWASTAEELEIGLNAVAAPIRNATGEVVAAVGVSGPSYRLTVESFPDVAAHLLKGAREISIRLGYFGSARL